MNGFSPRFVLNILLTLLFILIVSVNAVTYFQIQHLLRANKWVSHSQVVIYSINDLWNTVLESQVVLRDYAMGNGSNYFQISYQGTQNLPKQFDQIRELVSDNKNQLKRLKILEPMLKKYIAYFNDVTNNYKTNAIKSLVTSEQGKVLINQIQSITKELNNEEQLLLETRNQTLSANTQLANNYIVITNVITLLLLFLLFILINLQYSREMLAEKKRKQIQHQLKGIIEGTNDCIAAIDNHFNLIAFNHAFEKEFLTLFGKLIIPGMNLKESLAHLPQEQQNMVTLWEKVLNGHEFSIIQEFGDFKLTRNSYEITYSVIRDENNLIMGAAQILRNVTLRLQMEKAMSEANEQLSQKLLEIKQHSEALSLLNLLNSTLQSCFTVEETFGPINTFCQKIIPATAGILYLAHPSGNYMDFAVEWGTSSTHEKILSSQQCWALRRGQIHRYYNAKQSIPCAHVKTYSQSTPSYFCIPLQAQNEIVGLLYIEFLDTNQLSEAQIELLFKRYELLIITVAEAIALSLANIKLRHILRIRSIRDPLTGLFNRSYLDESFSREIIRAKRKNSTFAVIMLDLDHFKAINDTLGHEAGDLVLVEIGKLLLKEIRQSDIACRYGGEEMLLLLFDLDSVEEALARTETIREAISNLELFYHGQILPTCTASFGIALMPMHGENQQQLIEAADQALYRSKKEGRNRTSIAS